MQHQGVFLLVGGLLVEQITQQTSRATTIIAFHFFYAKQIKQTEIDLWGFM